MKPRKKKPGRPPGHPKTGGRKLGTPNKANVRLRDRFEAAGFDFAEEAIAVYRDLPTTIDKRDFLVRLAPFFMQRLREESEETPTPPPSPQADPSTPPEPDLTDVPTSDLLRILSNNPEGKH